MKSNAADATLRKGNQPKSEKVRTVNPDANKGLAKRLADTNDDGNPKRRTRSVSGGPTVPGTGQEN